jgi:hypothetical protein
MANRKTHVGYGRLAIIGSSTVIVKRAEVQT